MGKKKKPDVRRHEIITAAIITAKEKGYQNVTRAEIAKLCKIAEGTVNIYYKTMPQLRRDLMRYAVSNRVIPIVAQGLAMKDTHAQKADDELKQQAIKYLTES